MLRRLRFNFMYLLGLTPWDTGISPPELIDFIRSHPPGRALDLGCGTGTNLIMLAKHGWQATGVDFSARAIRTARRKALQARVAADIRLGDVTRLEDIQGPFDLILDIGCFHSLAPEGKTAYIQNLNHLLAPDGTFLLYGFFKPDGQAGPGLLKGDLQALSKSLQQVGRKDGMDRMQRRSVWMEYRRKTKDEGRTTKE